ncbi:MAG: hypothetical protein KDI14_19545 [Halioglobus sp.]|nr:hypothetical protein [Halioglobus sp.]
MNAFRTAISIVIFSTAAGISSIAGAANNIQLVYSGLAEPNIAQPPATQAFDSWCNGLCFPTTEQPVYDPQNEKQKGTIYVWGKDFQYGSDGSLCFSEFIVFALQQGEIHVASGTNGTCGAPLDPALKPPMYPDAGATVVLAGGGDGSIVGGTRKYAKWSGTYTDRTFIGFGAPTSGVGGIIYYDQLWFSISGK